MNTYQPGTVAVATVRGVPNVRVMWREESDGWREGWWAATGVGWNDPISVTDIRPLVVLDLDLNAHIGVPQMLADLRRDKWFDIADQIEAQTKPPRIPEPGLWGVVATGHADGSSVDYWTSGPGGWFNERGELRQWHDIQNPTLIRDGIEDAS